MEVIKNEKVKEEVTIEKLENGLTVMIVPKKNVKKKCVIWATKYGSNDSEFVVPGETKKTVVPNGVAHFLEHKLFEQENGTNSLDTLTALGVNANAYTSNNQTAYLFECTENFYEALDELMDYVQKPYFTDENVEKEKGIIGQEITMYDDYPEWRVYLNALKAMYHNHPIKLDIAGTIETISHIDKEILYKCYKTFYHPSNMVMSICGDFDATEVLNEVKKRLIKVEKMEEIQKIVAEEPDSIVQKEIMQEMEVSQPIYAIGIKTKKEEDIVKRSIAINVMLGILYGTSSNAYKKLYNSGVISRSAGLEYDYGDDYAYVLISGEATNPNTVLETLKEEITKIKENGIKEKDFERIKKVFYGSQVHEYDDVMSIARSNLSAYISKIGVFDYLDKIQEVDVEYATKVFKETFSEEKMVISIVKNK